MYACIMNIINFYQSNNTKTVKKLRIVMNHLLSILNINNQCPDLRLTML